MTGPKGLGMMVGKTVTIESLPEDKVRRLAELVANHMWRDFPDSYLEEFVSCYGFDMKIYTDFQELLSRLNAFIAAVSVEDEELRALVNDMPENSMLLLKQSLFPAHLLEVGLWAVAVKAQLDKRLGEAAIPINTSAVVEEMVSEPLATSKIVEPTGPAHGYKPLPSDAFLGRGTANIGGGIPIPALEALASKR